MRREGAAAAEPEPGNLPGASSHPRAEDTVLDSLIGLPLPPVTLVLGGQRSGKSTLAERLIETHGPGLYLATAEAGDPEMAERIRRHRERRGEDWTTVEEPLELARALRHHADCPVLVDCLTLWLANLMAAGRDLSVETRALTAALAGLAQPVVLVSGEVGQGVIPATPLGRRFADEAGALNQAVAGAAQRVVLVTAGLATVLKETKNKEDAQ